MIVRLRNLMMAPLAAAVLTPAGPLGGPAQAAASPASGIGIRLVDGPTTAPADSRAWSYIIDRLAAGAVIHRRIQVSNTTDSTQHISLYAAAAQFTDQQVQFAPGRFPRATVKAEAGTYLNPYSIAAISAGVLLIALAAAWLLLIGPRRRSRVHGAVDE